MSSKQFKKKINLTYCSMDRPIDSSSPLIVDT